VASVRRRGLLVVGTPEIAFWPLGDPALWIVVEEGRRAMKAKQTPTVQVHEVVRRRALVERSAVVVLGAVPTVDLLARGAAITEPPGRVWPLVEVVDRREDTGGTRAVSARTIQAVRAATTAGGQVFVFVSRRGYAPAFRCVRCRELRRCPECGSGPDRTDICRRCGASLGPCAGCGGKRFEPLGAGIGRVTEELVRQFSEAKVGAVGTGKQIVVGSERDIPAVPSAALAVAVDADSLLMAPNYRAEEDGLRTLVRVASTVAKGGGRRAVIQTGQPGHRAFSALRSGHPMEFLRQVAEERSRDSLPPSGDLMAIEVTGDAKKPGEELDSLASDEVQVHGPESGGGRTRWFLHGADLQQSRVRLRRLVQGWRDAGLKVRIDADPIDL
jgi:primosomal protein N' (replication factor Y)